MLGYLTETSLRYGNPTCTFRDMKTGQIERVPCNKELVIGILQKAGVDPDNTKDTPCCWEQKEFVLSSLHAMSDEEAGQYGK